MKPENQGEQISTPICNRNHLKFRFQEEGAVPTIVNNTSLLADFPPHSLMLSSGVSWEVIATTKDKGHIECSDRSGDQMKCFTILNKIMITLGLNIVGSI